ACPAPAAAVTVGVVNSGVRQSQAGTAPTPPLTDGALFADVIPGIGRNLGIAVVNTTSTTSTVTLTLKEGNRNTAGPALTFNLAPQHQFSRLITQLYSDTIRSSFVGSIREQGSSSITECRLPL